MLGGACRFFVWLSLAYGWGWRGTWSTTFIVLRLIFVGGRTAVGGRRGVLADIADGGDWAWYCRQNTELHRDGATHGFVIESACAIMLLFGRWSAPQLLLPFVYRPLRQHPAVVLRLERLPDPSARFVGLSNYTEWSPGRTPARRRVQHGRFSPVPRCRLDGAGVGAGAGAARSTVAWTKPGALHCFRAVQISGAAVGLAAQFGFDPHFGSWTQGLLRRIVVGARLYQDARWRCTMAPSPTFGRTGYTFRSIWPRCRGYAETCWEVPKSTAPAGGPCSSAVAAAAADHVFLSITVLTYSLQVLDVINVMTRAG